VASAATRWPKDPVESPAVVSVVLGRFDTVVGPGLEALLRADSRVRVLACDLDSSTLEVAMARWAPSVTILTSATELAVLKRLRSVGRGTRVLVLGYEVSFVDGLRVLGAGASCVALGAPDVDVLGDIHEAARGSRFFAGRDGRRLERKRLTEREWEVLELLVEGATYQQIALVLRVSTSTAEKHVLSVLAKLGVRRKRELVGSAFSTDGGGACGELVG
jgi:two-component system, NarL family, response regulator FusR